MTQSVRIAQVIGPTEAEGPGLRLAVWVQGCPLRCAECCNPAMLSERGGVERTVDDLNREIEAMKGDIEGITFLGGEPFSQAAPLAEIAKSARKLGLSVMAFSGFTRAELEAKGDAPTDALLAECDLLVDGPYERDKPDRVRRWIGSRNQVMHFLTDRYQPSDPQFVGEESFEVRYKDGEVTVNGWPASADVLIRLMKGRRRA